MCEPTTIAIAMAVASTAVTAYGMDQERKATNEMAREQQKQIDASASTDMNDRIKAARAQRASARAASAEAGVSGNSVQALLNDVAMQSGIDVSRMEKNRQMGIAGSEAERIARNRNTKAQGISSIAGTATNTYGNYQSLKIAGDT